MADNRSSLHQGQATERDVKSASARVGFDDLGGTASGFFQVIFPAAGGWNFFWTPKEGDQVVTSRLSNGAEEGYIHGKVYTAGKMPQGGAPNVILLVSDDGKNVIRLDADKGTLDVIIDQDGKLKFNNLEVKVNELTDLMTKNLKVEVEEHTGLETNDLDVESAKPIGFEGTKTQLGADFLVPFLQEIIKAVTRNPLIIPPTPLPPGAPVPPVPPIINTHLKGVWDDIKAACDKALIACAKVLK